MSENIKQFYKKLGDKKYLPICIAVFIIILLLIAYFLMKDGTWAVNATDNSVEDTLKAELETILGEIEGVGDVKVMITYASTAEIVYDKTVSTGLVTSEEPVKIKELLPEILGVVVVAEGADKIKTKVDLVNAVKIALNIDGSKIQVFAK